MLVVFQGPHGYVSPTKYDSSGVPTGNYQVVHVYGKAKIIKEIYGLRNIVDHLSAIYESDSEAPWVPEYNETLLNAIVGIEIDIHELQGKYKLSQNRSESDRKRVAENFEAKNLKALADAMKREM